MRKSPLKPGNKKKILVELTYVTTLLALYITILHPFLSNQDIYGWGTDIYGHLYKIWKVMNNGYIEWTKDWYAGFPLFRFYPPLSYLIAAGIGKIFNSDIIGFKITVLLAMIVGAYGMRLLLKELDVKEKVAYFISVLYPIYPFFYTNVIGEGAFPRFVALMLLPLFILAFLYVFKYKNIRKLILSSLFISIVILIHHNTAFTSVLLVIGLLPYFFVSKKISFKEILKNVFIVSLVTTLLVSFWVIPFILELKYSGFENETRDLTTFKFFSVNPKLVFHPFYDRQVNLVYLMLAIVGYSLCIIKNNNINLKIFALSNLLMLFLFGLLSLGYYSPLRKLNELMIFNRIPPYRFLDTLGLILVFGIARLFHYIININTKKKQIFKVFSLLLIFILISSNYLIIFNEISKSRFDNNLILYYHEILNFVNKNKDEFKSVNFYHIGVPHFIGSALAYFPIISEISLIDGWYRQGINRSKALFLEFPFSENYQNVTVFLDYIIGSLESKLSTQNVKCIVTIKLFNNYSNVKNKLMLLKFYEGYENLLFELWCWSKNSFVTPKHYQLIREYKIGRLFALVGNPLILDGLGIDYDHFKSLDDISNHENIFAYKVIFLYDYGSYNNDAVWEKLEKFVRRGGVLVVDTFRSRDMGSKIFNISSHVVKVEKRSLSSEVYDITRFDEFSRDFDWYATIYCGDLRPIIKYTYRDSVRNEECAAIGYKTIGYGYVIFIGLNLPDHIRYTGNEYEEFVLRDIIERFIPLFPDIIEHRVLEYSDGKIRLMVNSKYDAWVLIAQSYFPGWRAKLNGVEIPVYEDQIYGLIELYIPEGTWIIELEFVDRWLWLKYVSLFTLIAVVMALIYPKARSLLRLLRISVTLLSS